MTERKSIPGGLIEREGAQYWFRRADSGHRTYISHIGLGGALWTQAEQIEVLREVFESVKGHTKLVSGCSCGICAALTKAKEVGALE